MLLIHFIVIVTKINFDSKSFKCFCHSSLENTPPYHHPAPPEGVGLPATSGLTASLMLHELWPAITDAGCKWLLTEQSSFWHTEAFWPICRDTATDRYSHLNSGKIGNFLALTSHLPFDTAISSFLLSSSFHPSSLSLAFYCHRTRRREMTRHFKDLSSLIVFPECHPTVRQTSALNRPWQSRWSLTNISEGGGGDLRKMGCLAVLNLPLEITARLKSHRRAVVCRHCRLIFCDWT